MNEPNRRDFLASAGGVLASASFAVGKETAVGGDPASAPAPIPPHVPMVVEGVHAYTDRVSVAAGEVVRFHVSSSHPYELQVCRLGTDVDGPSRDQVVYSSGPSPAATQPIHPGSYLMVEKPLDPEMDLSALTIEVWIRRWRTIGRQAIIGQYDQPAHCGYGLFVYEDGSIGFYLGDGRAFDGGVVKPGHFHRTAPGALRMEVNPQGLKTFPDNTPSSVLSNQWHHLVLRFDGTIGQVWIDGRPGDEWIIPGPVCPGESALRIGAAGFEGASTEFLDADIAMPAIYRKALSPAEIAARFADRAATLPADPALLACWPLNEERGERAADVSPHGRHARIINGATWMIGGPGFDADVPRFGTYDPAKDPRRGHGLRLASDDLLDCRWKASHEVKLAEDARSGIYAGRIRFRLDGEERLYHTVFIVKKAPGRPRAPIAFLCATNTWKAYAATPFSPTWKGIKKSIGNNGFANSLGDPPAGFDLRLMSVVNRASPIPADARNLVVVAAVDQVLHFRIFDRDGKTVVDTDEKRLTERVRAIEDLRNQLKSLWPPHELTESEKGRVITAVASIVGHTPPAFGFYRPHRAGQGTYRMGFRMPWPIAGPYTLMGPEAWDYSHLCRQDHFTQAWLEAQGYDHDVLSDTDLHLDPDALDGYRVLFVVGHSEYWSAAAMGGVGRFLDRGGNLVVLSGNTAFWRVSFNADATVIECRKGDAPGSQLRADRRGEMWHSDDGRRGGMARECGFPAWQLFGLEYFALVGAGATGVGPYRVRNPDHFLFRRPHDLKLREGDPIGGTPGHPLPQPIGHEADARVSTIAKFLVDPPPQGGSQPVADPAGITLLADGYADAKVGFAWDYFQRPVPVGKAPPISVAAEMIYWERPGGGRVFHAGSINAGSTLTRDPKWAGLMHNVLSHFGVARG